MSSAVPAVPVHVSADECAAMRQRQIKKHDVAIMLLHWFNAAVWGLELLTGLAIIAAPRFKLAPEWYVATVQGMFGTPANVLRVHEALGLTWIAVFLVYGVFGFRAYLSREVLQKEIALDGTDIRWLIVRVKGILARSGEPLPPQGIYNAGQKLFAVMVYAMLPIVMVTGLVMAFRLFGPTIVGWAVVVHFVAVGTVLSGLLIHVYMGAVFPEEKPAFFSMITGSVNELYAYRHHFTWWREVKLAELERRRHHDARPAAGDAAAVPDAPESADQGSG